MTWTLPNILTVGRIVLAPAIAILPFFHGYLPKLGAVFVFLVAAIYGYDPQRGFVRRGPQAA